MAAWTEQATEALRLVHLSAGATQGLPGGLSVPLGAPLDERYESGTHEAVGLNGSRQVHTTCRPSEPIRRDSLKRREALLKGKEGSRQRRRWENGTLPF